MKTPPEKTPPRFASPAVWLAVVAVLAVLACAVKHAEESQLYSSELVWKALALCALGAAVQFLGAFVRAIRKPHPKRK